MREYFLTNPLHILRRVAKAYSIEVEDITSKRRNRRLIMARMDCIKELSEATFSGSDIANVMNMTRASVNYYKDKIRKA